jgi:phosphate:Na+ symporter
MDVVTIVLGTIGGLALFLYGLHTLSDSLEKSAGEKIRQILTKLTENPLKGCFLGAFTAALLQSSGLTMITLIGMINAGIMTLRQGIGVMLGSEIGTTVTAQLIAFKIGVYFLPLIAFGFFLSFLAKKRKYKIIGQMVLSFGLVYLGMNIMSTSIQPLQNEPGFTDFLSNLGQFPLYGLILGVTVTAIFQSSSAMMGLAISLGVNNLITLPAAIAVVLGANVGTCITAMLASIGSSLSSKRLALTQLTINLVGVLLFFPFIANLSGLVQMTSSDLPRQIANFHSVFNIIITVLMLPLIGFLVTVVKRLLPGEEPAIRWGTEFIDVRLLNVPSIALAQAEKEVNRMAEITCEMLDKATSAIVEDQEEAIGKVKRMEEAVDEINEAVDRFLDEIRSEDLSEHELRVLACLKHSITDIERVGDHANNLVELAERKQKGTLKFSKEAKDEIETMCMKTKLIYKSALTVLADPNREVIQKVRNLEDEIDNLQRVFEENHVRRLENKICSPLMGIIFVDILRNLERIADHSTNIVNAMLLGF